MSDELIVLQRIEELVTVIAKTLLSDKLEGRSSTIQSNGSIYEGAGRISVKDLAKKAHVSFTTVSGSLATMGAPGFDSKGRGNPTVQSSTYVLWIFKSLSLAVSVNSFLRHQSVFTFSNCVNGRRENC